MFRDVMLGGLQKVSSCIYGIQSRFGYVALNCANLEEVEFYAIVNISWKHS